MPVVSIGRHRVIDDTKSELLGHCRQHALLDLYFDQMAEGLTRRYCSRRFEFLLQITHSRIGASHLALAHFKIQSLHEIVGPISGCGPVRPIDIHRNQAGFLLRYDEANLFVEITKGPSGSWFIGAARLRGVSSA